MSLKVWLPLNGDLHNQGCSNITVNNTGATVDANGKIGSCYNFVSKQLSFQTPFAKTIDNFSVTAWVNLNTGYAANYGFHIINFNLSYGRICISKDNAAVRVLLSNGSNIAVSSTATASTLTAGVWNHFAITFSNGTVKIYINGILDKEQTISISSFTYTSDILYVGSYSSEGANGKLNDLRLYDHCLSAAEVREISQGLVLHYKLDDITNGIQDSSGYNHNGEILNGPLTIISEIPRYNSCVHISATNQKIKISNFPTSGFGNSYTFSWWAKINSTTPMHWGFTDGIRLNGMYTGRLWNTGDSSNNPLYNIGTTTQVTAPSVNVWHHWAMTGNGTKCYVYQDGQLWAEAKTYKAISGSTIYINGWDAGTGYSSNNYSVSDFRIYATALSAEDILSLYNTSMKIDNLQNIHSFELVEDQASIKVTQTGQLKCKELTETTKASLRKDKDIYANYIIER